MWNGRIAFARRDPDRHKDVAQILLWSPGKARLRRLPHGGVPSGCPYRTGCKRERYIGEAAGLDLGSRVATYLWLIAAPGVGGHLGYEVRAVRLSDRHSALVGSGYEGEACTEGVDAVVPSLPVADSSRVWYSLRAQTCYDDRYQAVRFNTLTGSGVTGPVDVGELLQFVKYGSAFYGVIAPKPTEEDPHFDGEGVPCEIRRLSRPSLRHPLRKPQRPY
jgi:hypothetical protein